MSAIMRVQTPVPPYPYLEKEVVFINASDGTKLAGTITYPKTGADFPCTILITGATPQDRNEEGFGGHRFFQVLADDLTKKGVAVLRYDDRGTAKSTGKYNEATIFDFANDAEAGLDFLKTVPFIDKTKIGFIGHSEGGFVAQIVAGRRADTAFIILMAGPIMPTVDILRFQMKGAQDRIAVLGWKIENVGALLDQALDIALKEERLPVIREKIAALFNRSNLPDEMKKSLTDYFSTPEMVFAVKTNPADYLAKVTCPILALGGSKDMAVPAKENHEALRQIMAKLGRSNYEIVEFPNMNHFFQTTTNGMFYYVPQIEETMSPVAMKTMGDWILKTTGKKTNQKQGK
jgi:pimeloyl-ACP methyl ester carboxylesterase